MSAPNVFPVYHLQHWKVASRGNGLGSTPWSTSSSVLVTLQRNAMRPASLKGIVGLDRIIGNLLREGNLFKVSLQDARDARLIASLFSWQSTDLIPVLLPGVVRNFDWEIPLDKVPVFLNQTPEQALARQELAPASRSAQ